MFNSGWKQPWDLRSHLLLGTRGIIVEGYGSPQDNYRYHMRQVSESFGRSQGVLLVHEGCACMPYLSIQGFSTKHFHIKIVGGPHRETLLSTTEGRSIRIGQGSQIFSREHGYVQPTSTQSTSRPLPHWATRRRPTLLAISVAARFCLTNNLWTV